MTWTPPISDRPVEFNIDDIKTATDAELALGWFDEKIDAMNAQIEYCRLAYEEMDMQWMARVKKAINLSSATYKRVETLGTVLRREEKMQRQIRLEEAFMNATLSLFNPEDVNDVWEVVYSKHPELRKA